MGISIGLITLTLSITLLYLTQKYFLRNNIVDSINARSSHKVIATRSGGIGIFLSLCFISFYHYVNQIEIFNFSLVIPLSILLLVGLYDDLHEVDFKLKFLFQIITAKILIDNGFVIDNFHGILGINELNRVFAQGFSIFIIVAIINSINFIDGIDGLAASVVSLFIILFHFFALEQTPYNILSNIILITLIPFFYFNIFSKNKVFLGDSGSLLLGGVVSIYVLHILSNEYLIIKEYDINKILFVISILSYPIVDIVRIFFLRVYKGRSPFIADKNHIHHLVLNQSKSHIKTTFIIVIASILVTILIQLLF
jgi:UDP-GlcNAc:undecaprenyl-phosphate/decaprenyl-phosphate GlcNAc-1-phosphate transferase